MKRRPQLTVDVTPKVTSKDYYISSSMFREGEIEVTSSGLTVSGKSPMIMQQEQRTNLDKGVMQEEYRVLDLKTLKEQQILGSGASGVVKKVLHTTSRKFYALKCIPLDEEDEVRKNIINEIKALASTQFASPYIIGFFDAFFSDGQIQIVMEYMDGGSLADIVQKKGAFPERILKACCAQIVHGLKVLAIHHVIHRDIKPSNILCTTKGQVKIADFGVSGQRGSTLSTCNSWLGTVTYMSPERIGGGNYKISSDIWSFGLVALELALGIYPYFAHISASEKDHLANVAKKEQKPTEDGTFWKLLERIVNEDSPLPKPTKDKYSEALIDFLSQCLKKDPNERTTPKNLLKHSWFCDLDTHNCLNEFAPFVRDAVRPKEFQF